MTKPKLRKETILLNMGPQHPSTHGVIDFFLEVDGEEVVGAEVKMGYLHRAVERLAEFRTYPQIFPLVDRLDYLSAHHSEFAYALAVEKLLQVDVPERADHIRVILVELKRIASHLLFYGAFAMDAGSVTPFLYAWREREKVMDLLEDVCGIRLHPNYFRFGGVREDLPPGFLEQTINFVDKLPFFLDEYEAMLGENEIFQVRTIGIGKVSPKRAINLGLTGPYLRGTGLKWDLRRDEPYSVYPKFDFEIPTGKQGDCFDSYKVRIEEMRQSGRIIKQAIEKIPDGPIRTSFSKKVIKPPKGEAYARVESPRGELGVYVVSDGSARPYRLKVRAPSFTNVQAFPELAKNHLIADAVMIIGALDPVIGEVDR